MPHPVPIPINDPADPALDLFTNLRDRDLRRTTDLFLAEGRLVVERLLDSGLSLHSLIVTQGKADDLVARVPASVPVFAAPEALLEQAVGFHLHSGLIAAAHTPPNPTLDACTTPQAAPVLVLPEITNPDNLGLLARIAAGLGVGSLVLGPACHDPWYRRAVRVSMGAMFQLPVRRSPDLAGDLEQLKATHGYMLIAADCAPDATPLRDHQPTLDTPRALMLGNEFAGIPKPLADRCDHRLRIPMHREIDSLNVAVAAGIFLHHLLPG
ncbi:MAG: RNA methyltransferase [Planctomycetota bacterium]